MLKFTIKTLMALFAVFFYKREETVFKLKSGRDSRNPLDHEAIHYLFFQPVHIRCAGISHFIKLLPKSNDFVPLEEHNRNNPVSAIRTGQGHSPDLVGLDPGGWKYIMMNDIGLDSLLLDALSDDRILYAIE